MKVYFNDKKVVEFDNTANKTPEEIRATIAGKKPAIKTANYNWSGGDLYFYKDAKELG